MKTPLFHARTVGIGFDILDARHCCLASGAEISPL
jgi:hypothetical protein